MQTSMKPLEKNFMEKVDVILVVLVVEMLVITRELENTDYKMSWLVI